MIQVASASKRTTTEKKIDRIKRRRIVSSRGTSEGEGYTSCLGSNANHELVDRDVDESFPKRCDRSVVEEGVGEASGPRNG